MAESTPTQEVVWHLADGRPTDDKDAATTAEVVTTYSDGRVTRTLMRRKDDLPSD